MPFDAGTGQLATSLPTAYTYSDYSLGLLGLLLAGGSGPLANGDLNRWYRRIERQLTGPLGMERTFLKVPQAVTNRSEGYVTVVAEAIATGGAVTAIRLARPVYGHNIVMGQLRRVLRLGFEAFDELGIRRLFTRQNLKRDIPTEIGVDR